MQGVPIGEIAPVTCGAWVRLPDECAQKARALLASTSFVEVLGLEPECDARASPSTRTEIYWLLMSVALSQDKTFPVSFTAASLRPELARIVTQAYLDCGDWERARKRVLAQNLLQARSSLSAVRMEREIRHRLQMLTPQQLHILAHAPISTGAALAWLSVLKHSPFVFAFAVDVLRAKYEGHDAVLRPSDYEGFFEAQVIAHPELARLTASTRQKMCGVMVTMLREVGIVAHPGKDPVFGRPVLPIEVFDAIVADQPAWLAGFLVPDREIQSLAR